MTENNSGQDYQNSLPERNKLPERPYTGPKKMKDVGNLLDGIDDLVNKGNLADNYKQTGGQ